jgi:hypothetical protein
VRRWLVEERQLLQAPLNATVAGGCTILVPLIVSVDIWLLLVAENLVGLENPGYADTMEACRCMESLLCFITSSDALQSKNISVVVKNHDSVVRGSSAS